MNGNGESVYTEKALADHPGADPVIGLSMPASSLTATPDKGLINNIPVPANNPADTTMGGESTGQDLSIPLNHVDPGGIQIAFKNANVSSGVDNNRIANATNKTAAANATNASVSNQSAPVADPAGKALSYPDFNFNANAGQISNMSLLDRMWRNSHFFCSMGRAYEGDTSYPDWILPTEYTKSAIAMANWYNINGVALNYTLPGTHLTPRYWSLDLTSPINPDLNNWNFGGQFIMG